MKNKILVVDDMELNRDILQEMLEEDYDVVQAEDGKQAIEQLEAQGSEIIAVLLDLIMPEMDGFAVLDVMREQDLLKKIPVLVISGETSVEAESKCFEYGVSDFIKKPFADYIVKRRVKNIVDLFSYQNQLEEKVEKQTKILRKQNDVLRIQAVKLEENNEHIIDIMAAVVESRDLESGEHIKRVKGFTRILGYQMMMDHPECNLTPDRVEMIAIASALHDIGKIAIPDSILLKPGKLTDEEFEVMKTHTTEGCEILNNIEGIWEDDYRTTSSEICRHHHERYDGRGYPDKLKGEEIPISAQIVSVADVYDALVSKRVYKGAYGLDEAYDMIQNGECGVFSPKLMISFRNARKEFEDLVEQRKEENSFDE